MARNLLRERTCVCRQVKLVETSTEDYIVSFYISQCVQPYVYRDMKPQNKIYTLRDYFIQWPKTFLSDVAHRNRI